MQFALFRAGMLAMVVTCLSLAGHAAGRGTLPGGIGLLLVVVVAVGLTWTAVARRRSFAWLLAYLLGVQLLLHVVLVLAVPHGHSMGHMPLLPTADMALGHVVASLLAAALLARGEQVVDAWSRLLRARLVWSAPSLAAPVGAPAVRADAWQPTPLDAARTPRRRGPPRSPRA